MSRIINEVAVVGLGNIGGLVARLLHLSGFEVVALDLAPGWMEAFDDVTCATVDAESVDDLASRLDGVDALVSCPHWSLNGNVAEEATRAGVHYLDLTEDVDTTRRTRALAEARPDVVMVPHCGLAPGLICIVGATLIAELDRVRSVQLKVGALPQNPLEALGYGFTGSPDGVINEYLNPSEVVEGGVRTAAPSLTGDQRVEVNGVELEASVTSGGLDTMCDKFDGVAESLNHKTRRYLGHFDQIRFLMDELGLRQDRALATQLLLAAAPPPDDDDVVSMHAAVTGTRDGRSVQRSFVRAHRPQVIGSQRWSAIAWTTAASVVGVVELVAKGRLPSRGLVTQEWITLEGPLSARAGALFVKEGEPA